MPHWPLTEWGIIYCAALAFFGVVTWLGPRKRARIILAILNAHAVSWAAIMAYDPGNFFLWLGQDAAIIAALLLLCRSPVGVLCSLAYWAVLVQDGLFLHNNLDATLSKLPVDKSSILAEVAGYIAMLAMAGAAHGMGGRLHRVARRVASLGSARSRSGAVSGGRSVSSLGHRAASKASVVEASRVVPQG
jgi:hypothetical protein